MTYLLVVYGLDLGRTLHMEELTDRRAALEARFATEAVAVGRLEIVVLAGRVEDMRRTHGKYFTPGWEASR